MRSIITPFNFDEGLEEPSYQGRMGKGARSGVEFSFSLKKQTSSLSLLLIKLPMKYFSNFTSLWYERRYIR